MDKAKVLIVMGSASDKEIMGEAAKMLGEFGVGHKMSVASAHRTPEKVREMIGRAKRNGIEVIIAGAGYAAHLAGVIASHTTLPVIGVPLDASSLNGIDSLLSTVQMPAGIPVATMAIGKAGAKNAALFAIEILALSDDSLAKKLVEYREKMVEKVEADDKEING